jgi:nickel/cobalt transporter (NiCoT) family protein
VLHDSRHDVPHSQRVRHVSFSARVTAIFAVLAGANVLVWIATFLAFHDRPALLGTALLAYTFGLRHAVDADHIAAIDNVTRRLIQTGRRPYGVGIYFSLGHSTIVVALTIAIALGATAVKAQVPTLQSLGGLVGTLISAGFLGAIAVLNALTFIDVFAAFRRVQRGEPYREADAQALLAGPGFLGRIFRPILASVASSRNMYVVGLLFGLGFDTATEVGLMGIAALEATHGLPVLAIMLFPLLFTVGMCLLDAADGILMIGAYGWAFVKPVRKLYYNLTVTLVSVVVALFVGAIEVLGILGDRYSLGGPFWEAIGHTNENFGVLGFGIVGVFVLSWLAAFLVYRWRGYDRLEFAREELTA